MLHPLLASALIVASSVVPVPGPGVAQDPEDSSLAQELAGVRFGTALPWCAEPFLLHREMKSTISVQVFVDGELSKDVDVVHDEDIELTLKAVVQDDGRVVEGKYEVAYAKESRFTHPGVFIAEAVPGGTRYQGAFSREILDMLDRDLDDPTEVHRFSRALSGRSLALGDRVELEDRMSLQRLIGSRFELEEMEIRLDRIETMADETGERDLQVAVFALRTVGRSEPTEAGVARTSCSWSGTFSIRVDDLLPVALVLEGPLELEGEWEEFGRRVRTTGSGSATLDVQFLRPIPEVEKDGRP